MLRESVQREERAERERKRLADSLLWVEEVVVELLLEELAE